MTTTVRTCPCGRPTRPNGRSCGACASRALREHYAVVGVPLHGYIGYTNGCRCETCREAKRAYMAQRRAAAVRAAEQRAEQGAVKAADHLHHGTQHAYYEHGCRCPKCIAGGRTWRSRPTS